MNKMKEKQVAMKAPGWLKDVKNDNVAGAIFALLFSWAWDSTPKKIDNLREYVASQFDDMTDDEIAEVCDLLIEHKVVAQ